MSSEAPPKKSGSSRPRSCGPRWRRQGPPASTVGEIGGAIDDPRRLSSRGKKAAPIIGAPPSAPT